MPTLREKNRYLVYHVSSEIPVSADAIQNTLTNTFLQLFGTVGYGKGGIQFLDMHNQKGIIKTNTTLINTVRAGLAFVSAIRGVPAVAHSIGVSGTLAHAHRAYFSKGG